MSGSPDGSDTPPPDADLPRIPDPPLPRPGQPAGEAPMSGPLPAFLSDPRPPDPRRLPKQEAARAAAAAKAKPAAPPGAPDIEDPPAASAEPSIPPAPGTAGAAFPPVPPVPPIPTATAPVAAAAPFEPSDSPPAASRNGLSADASLPSQPQVGVRRRPMPVPPAAADLQRLAPAPPTEPTPPADPPSGVPEVRDPLAAVVTHPPRPAPVLPAAADLQHRIAEPPAVADPRHPGSQPATDDLPALDPPSRADQPLVDAHPHDGPQRGAPSLPEPTLPEPIIPGSGPPPSAPPIPAEVQLVTRPPPWPGALPQPVPPPAAPDLQTPMTPTSPASDPQGLPPQPPPPAREVLPPAPAELGRPTPPAAPPPGAGFDAPIPPPPQPLGPSQTAPQPPSEPTARSALPEQTPLTIAREGKWTTRTEEPPDLAAAGSLDPRLRERLRGAVIAPCLPWPRRVLLQADWAQLADALGRGVVSLVALWADTLQVHALLLDEVSQTPLPVSTTVEGGRYPALSPACPAAIGFERMIHDLWGHAADGATDTRPWLDHGTWPQSKPLAIRPEAPLSAPSHPEAPVSAVPVMQLGLGPLWGRIEEAERLTLTIHGSTIIAAEAQLGFTHKGVLALVRGKAPRTAARFAARLSGDATVAHSLAFAIAVEAALSVTAPPRAIALRTVMLELERIAGHLDNLAETARLAGAHPMESRCAWLRERLVRATAAVFGHRLMMDCVVPGGVAVNLAEGGAETILRALGEISSNLGAIRRGLDGTALSVRLAGVAPVDPALARAYAVGGVVGRSAGRRFDARAIVRGGSPPTRTRQAGDAISRLHRRVREIEDSLRLISAALDQVPAGPLTAALTQASGEGMACVESIRGDVWHWLRLDHGQIASFFPRDPGWGLWPLAEHVLIGAEAADVDLIRVSLALPASGMDL